MINTLPGVMSLLAFHKDPCSVLFYFLFTSTIYLMVLYCNPKFFADDTSLFSTVYNINETTNTLNNDLNKITEWAHQWNMRFNPDISKKAHEVVFSRKRSLVSHPSLTFNNIPVAQTSSQKHLGMHLDKKINFEEHLSKVETKVNKSVGIIRNSKMSFHDQFINHLLDLSYIMET